MSYDRESFIQSFVSFLPKNINELESRLNQMREDMEQAVQALIQNQKGRFSDINWLATIGQRPV